MKIKKVSGIILKISPFREFDRIIWIFTAEQGVVRIIAKGVRRSRSHRSYHLDLLNAVDMELEEVGQHPSTRLYLREVITLEGHPGIKADPLRFCTACIIATFLVRMVPESAIPQPELFEITKKTFDYLNSPTPPPDILQTYFLKAIKCLGHMAHSLPKESLRKSVWESLEELDSQFTLQARRTLGIFSRAESTRSN